MQLSSIKAVTIEDAFKAFYELMVASEYFKEYFDNPDQMEIIIMGQADSFYQSLSMSDKEFKDNYIQLGLSYAKMVLPLEVMVSALSMVRDYLLKNTPVQAPVIYRMIEKWNAIWPEVT